MVKLKNINREPILNDRNYRFVPTDFESLNGEYTWSTSNIKKVRNKLKHLKEPLHEKLKNGLGIDFKSNIGGGYPYGEHPINSIWLSFTQRKDRAYLPYPQLNVEINTEGLAVYFQLIDKSRVKTGKEIWEKHCNNSKNGLESDKKILIKLKEQKFEIKRAKDIEMAIKNIDSQGIWIHKEFDKNSVINLQYDVSDEIFSTLKLLYPIYKIAMSSQT
ncbi:MAG: DUF1054 family protein (plasmid) [Candidatus Methanoperedens sp.]|nr:MAG: DUF1054 family protein [Candidatus Methanoperedens sp.]